MTKSEIIKKLKPHCNGVVLPMSLNVSVVAELLKDEPECTIPSVRRSCLVDISLIRMDRHPMNPSTLSLIDYLREGGEVPAIKIAKHPKGGYIIRDGRHRVLAYKLLGRTKIKAKFSDKAMFNTIPDVSISLPSDEEIREPIQNAIYATGSYTTDQCTEFADGILTYLNEAGYKVVRQ